MLLGVYVFLLWDMLRNYTKKKFKHAHAPVGRSLHLPDDRLAFGSAYEIVCVLEIQCKGIEIPLQTMALMRRYEFSLMILSGMNSPYDNPIGMIFSIGTIEAVRGQLFIVLIVGRLLMK